MENTNFLSDRNIIPNIKIPDGCELFFNETTGRWVLRNCKGFSTKYLKKNSFVPNIVFETEVDHINSDRTDNRASNLRWVSRNENMQNVPKERRKRGVKQPVVQYDLEGNFIKEYSSAAEAARENGYRADVICWCCRGKLKTAYGFVWRRIQKNM